MTSECSEVMPGFENISCSKPHPNNLKTTAIDTPRPVPLTVNFENVPSELKLSDQWVCWRYDWNGSKWDKPPRQINGRKASTKTAATWASLDDVEKAYNFGVDLLPEDPKHLDGIGFVLQKKQISDLQIIGVDLDDCCDPDNGELTEDAKDILELFNSYSEISPSGTGIRIFLKGEMPNEMRDGKRKGGYEIYQSGRYLTITGQRIEEYPASIEIRREEVKTFFERYISNSNNKPQKQPTKTTNLTDDQIIALASQAKNADKFTNLMNGNWDGYKSQSEADLALCSILAFYTRNEEQIDRVFRRSKLLRDKWIGRDDYRDDTIKNALSRITDYYKGNGLSDLVEVDKEIHEKAMGILRNGDPIQYIADSCGRMVLGADEAFKKLICCISVQNILQSMGLHPKLNGESGGGKTWALMTFAHHLPEETVIKGSMSTRAGFYHDDGDRVLRILDDYEAGTEDLDTVIKQTSSSFHEPYKHRTVVKHEPKVLQIGKEQTWAITSVDSSQDIQVLNRQIPINVDDSEELTKLVNNRTIERYTNGETQFPEDKTTQVCREIFRILRAEGYINIKVPFGKRIEWLDTSNRRNPPIFMDLLIAITAMNRYQRDKDQEGFYLATTADFYAAKKLFTDKGAEELVHRLTRKEREFADLLRNNPSGLTREKVAEALKISPNRVSQLANGEKGKGGLTQKLRGFDISEISDSIKLGNEQTRNIRRTIYRLISYDPMSGFDAVVALREEDNHDESASTEDSKDSKDGVRN